MKQPAKQQIIMMLGREVRLPDALHLEVIQSDDMDASEYARELQQRLHIAASHLREMQRKIMDETSEEPHVYSVGDEVWLKSLYKKRERMESCYPNTSDHIQSQDACHTMSTRWREEARQLYNMKGEYDC